MTDVFGGLAGGPGDEQGGVSTSALDAALDGAILLGMELDSKFRVLAATFEPTADNYVWGESGDRRVQVLCFPVSTILASLRRNADDGIQVWTFEEAKLVDVVAALDAPPVSAPVFGHPEPSPGEWGPYYSLEGRSSAPDGRRQTLRLALRNEGLELDVFARFDEVALRDAAGNDLELPG